jgi:1-acyl-sn-glycerol-3-phosphate acyltransferase
MADLRPWLQRACARFFYDRIDLIGGERLPDRGPALYLGLHRNGAVDGLVHRCVLRRATFLLASRWRKGLLRRTLFDGIVVVREKDGGDRSANAAALAACVDHLRQGGELDIFPEGTSTLGPRHLPFKTGAARILSDFLASGGEITVLPIGLHYERAWAFRSRVEVVVGDPMDTRLEPGLGSEERVGLLHARIGRALEDVGVNLASDEEQELVERLSYAATLGTKVSYFRALKAFEKGVPDDLRAAWIDLERDPVSRRAFLHQGVPLVPIGPVAPYALLLLVLGPIVLAAIVANLPPLLLGLWAGKKLPDSSHIGIITKFMSPDTASIVRARHATKSPSAENASAATRLTAMKPSHEPRTSTPNTIAPNPTIAPTSSTSHTNRASISASR